MKHSVLKFTAVTALALILVGCEVGDDYNKPETSMPENWTADDLKAQDEKAEVDQTWWQNFNDPMLNSFITKAASDNLDMKIAEARIAQARASVSSAFAALLPTGDVKGTATREANQLALPAGAASNFGPVLKKPFNIFETGFDASWELDLFGGNRRAEESAEAQLQASEASRDDVRVSLLAEVARTYVLIRQYQMQLTVVENTIASDQKTLDISRQLSKAGQVPELDAIQAESVLENSQTQLPQIRNQLQQAEYSMDVLEGEQPGATMKLINDTAPIPTSNKQLVLAAPASVMAQRPDIRMAERKLASATAQQSVAVAKFFPDISITGFFGALNTSATNLVSPTNESWLAGGSVIWPILSYGTLSANLHQANAQQQEALATYQKTIIAALSDVERSLTAYQEQQKFAASVANEVAKDKQSRAVAQERYKAGTTSELALLDADRALDAAQIRLVEAQANTTQDLIALYKSLGGGWVKNDDPAPRDPG